MDVAVAAAVAVYVCAEALRDDACGDDADEKAKVAVAEEAFFPVKPLIQLLH